MAVRTRSELLLPRQIAPAFVRAVVFALLIAAAAVSLFPLYWMFTTAFTPVASTLRVPPEFIPSHPTLENFRTIFRVAPRMWRWLANTLGITLLSTAVHLLFDSMAGYAFAKKPFPGSNLLFGMVIAALMIPGQVTLVPLYLMITQLKLTNTYLGVILPGLADVIGIFLMKQYMQTLPSELADAARVDGASEWQIYTHVIVPLSRPALAVLAIFSFQRYWNSFLWPLVVLRNPDLYTLQVGLSFVHTTEFGTNYGLLMAGATFASIPMIIFFFAFQRYFMEGIRVGAIKG